MTPIGNGKDFGYAHDPSGEVVLAGVDGLFGRVSSMDVRWHVLEGSTLGLNEVFEIF